MKRSEVEELREAARACFLTHGWSLPPDPQWDITDFGLGDWRAFGLVLINLADEPEYCEKLMYARRGMLTPTHRHLKKKEDIICRWGELRVTCWDIGRENGVPLRLKIDLRWVQMPSGRPFVLQAGSRVTLEPGTWHKFEPVSAECIIGEVGTANDDLRDNVFDDPRIGRFPDVVDDLS